MTSLASHDLPGRTIVLGIGFLSVVVTLILYTCQSGDSFKKSKPDEVSASHWFSSGQCDNEKNKNNKTTLFGGETTQDRVDLILHCSNKCSEKQTCFLGKCTCLPGWNGRDCTKQTSAAFYSSWLERDCARFQNYSSLVDAEVKPLSRGCSFPGHHGRPVDLGPVDCAVLCYWSVEFGIAIVPKSFWSLVNDVELDHWSQGAKNEQEKNGVKHFEQPFPPHVLKAIRYNEYSEGFDLYKALLRAFPISTSTGNETVKIKIERFLEVGAGPVTITNHILQHQVSDHLDIEQIFLEEPNVLRYLKDVAMNTYRNGTLGYPNRKIPVSLLNVPLEELRMYETFDVVLVVNTVEHVQNAYSFLGQLYSALKCGGVLIFSERYFARPDENSTVVLGSPRMHPIRLNRRALTRLFGLFERVYLHDFRTRESDERGFGEAGYYFIGRKTCPVAGSFDLFRSRADAIPEQPFSPLN